MNLTTPSKYSKITQIQRIAKAIKNLSNYLCKRIEKNIFKTTKQRIQSVGAENVLPYNTTIYDKVSKEDIPLE